MRQRYREEGKQQCGNDAPQNGSRAFPEVAASRDIDTTAGVEQQTPGTSAHLNEAATNPLKRKYAEPETERWLSATEELNFAQHLPSQAVLLKIVDFFTTSFHHWIPYLHKQRLYKKVSEGTCSNGLLLVLHALVAVALRHMDSSSLFMDTDEVLRHSSISRTIVETHAIRSVSIESLQALIFIVFDYVSRRSLVCVTKSYAGVVQPNSA